jgi:hypothetical protein
MGVKRAFGEGYWPDLIRIGQVCLLTFLFVSNPGVARSASDPSQLCVDAARVVAGSTQVPFHVLMAIALTETGRSDDNQVKAWPWTVNMEGEGHWFPTKEAATHFAITQYDGGVRSFDTGCFQINYRRHGHQFRSIEDMFDPILTAEYAAKFLTMLYAEKGSWVEAAGAYHSRTKVHADRYQAVFNAHLARLTTAGAPMDKPSASRGRPLQQESNSFPLLITRQGLSRLGSLVPVRGIARSDHLFLRGDDG